MAGGRGSGEIGELPGQGLPVSGRAAGNDHSDVGVAAQDLWDALNRARAHYAPLVLTAAENAVVKFYLPLARTLASGWAVGGLDPASTEETAEVGLTHAVQGWQHSNGQGFDGYARATMATLLSMSARD